MSDETNHASVDPQERADHEAVMRHVIDGTPLDPEVARRVDERAKQIADEVYRIHGDVDIDQLLHDSDDA